MLSRFLILSLFLTACVAPLASQSPSDKSLFPSQQWNGLTPPQSFHLHVPLLSQNASLNQSQPSQIQTSPKGFTFSQNVNPTLPFSRKLAILAQNAAPCYLIRSYRFTREDPKSDITTFADYSTCQPASQFHVRSTVDTHPR